MKKKIWIWLMIVALVATCALAACDRDKFENPGDQLGGGGTGEVAEAVGTTDLDDAKTAVKNQSVLTEKDRDTSENGASKITPTAGVVEIKESGTYLFEGEYGGIKTSKKDLELHFIFKGAEITKPDGVAIDCQDKKVSSLVITLADGTTNTVTNGGEDVNAIHVKGGALTINGNGTLNVTSGSKNAVKCGKAIKIVDATLNLEAANHAISAAAVIAANCNIAVTSAGKDGINVECDEATEFTTTDGFLSMTNVNYSCDVDDDGIQANTVVYVNGGTYNIKSAGKGIKLSEIEYTNAAKETVVVTEGNYLIALDGGNFTINATDDGIHANSGNVMISGGTYSISSGDDAITATLLVKITGGNVNITKSYEGIEGTYVEISGGTINLKSSDDGINAANEDRSVKPHIIISGGDVTVNANGDGLDSNGSILISGGKVIVHGPTTGGDAGLDADKGIVVNGGILFATSTLGMVETPSTNSTQCVISYAQNSAITVGTKISIRDSKGNVLLEVEVLKNKCQSIIISHPDLKKDSKYSIYADDTKLDTFTISSIITSIGVSTQGRGPGGRPGGPGGPR